MPLAPVQKTTKGEKKITWFGYFCEDKPGYLTSKMFVSKRIPYIYVSNILKYS